VVVRDRVGIIADVTETLYNLGANLEAMSQTVVQGWFTMILSGTFPEHVTAQQIKTAIEATGEFGAMVLPFGSERPLPAVVGEPFIVTVVGNDKPGIVCRLARCFANRGINIEDVWNEVRDSRFIVIFHVTVPPQVDPNEARYDLERVAGQLGVSVTFQHQDIFTATSTLSVRTSRKTFPP